MFPLCSYIICRSSLIGRCLLLLSDEAVIQKAALRVLCLYGRLVHMHAFGQELLMNICDARNFILFDCLVYHSCTCILNLPVPVAAQSKAPTVFARTLGLWVRIPLRHGCVSAFLCVVLSCV